MAKKNKSKDEMNPAMKKKIIGHIKKDDKEFRSQIKDDKKLTKLVKSAKKS